MSTVLLFFFPSSGVSNPAFLHLVGGVPTAHDGRNAQLPRDDGGVAGAAPAVGDDGARLLPDPNRFLGASRWQPWIYLLKRCNYILSLFMKRLLKNTMNIWINC